MSGKKAVVYFYGADGAPSCTKQAKAFDAAALDATVVGVRSDEGVKDGFADEYGGIKFVVDVSTAGGERSGRWLGSFLFTYAATSLTTPQTTRSHIHPTGG